MSLRNTDASHPGVGALAWFARQHARLLMALLVIVVCLGRGGNGWHSSPSA